MNQTSKNLYPVFDRQLSRSIKETRLGQRGILVWLYGLSGSGKSTIAQLLERKLYQAGFFTELLDGDNVRSGLNNNLGFTDQDRAENIRRVAEVSKLFVQAGVITIASFICPKRAFRNLVRNVVGEDDVLEVYVKCPLEVCVERDPKGLYAKVMAGKIKNFTGFDSGFEEPESADLTLDSDQSDVEQCVTQLIETLALRIRLKDHQNVLS